MICGIGYHILYINIFPESGYQVSGFRTKCQNMKNRIKCHRIRNKDVIRSVKKCNTSVTRLSSLFTLPVSISLSLSFFLSISLSHYAQTLFISLHTHFLHLSFSMYALFLFPRKHSMSLYINSLFLSLSLSTQNIL